MKKFLRLIQVELSRQISFLFLLGKLARCYGKSQREKIKGYKKRSCGADVQASF
ncbi:hypothetical protein NEOC65_001652 [Neochlamydia sp. AcF65]|nr:hypothetical protein [Neochlamydia sp. AcF65]